MDKEQPKRKRVRRKQAATDRTDTTGQRGLTQKVKTAKGRRISSTKWLERQLNDPYVSAAKERGLRSRAAFKLEQIDDKFKLLERANTIVDLGAAPGGWSQVIADRIQASRSRPARIIAVDLQPMEPLAGVEILCGDFTDTQTMDEVRIALGGMADCVLSDMAAPATGHKQTDHLRIISLCESAFAFAESILRPGGSFVSKVLQGGTEDVLLERMKQSFKSVRHFKPAASRSDSAEMYVVALDFRSVPRSSDRPFALEGES